MPAGLVLLLPLMQAAAAAPPHWGTAPPGDYAVGFRQVWRSDSTRTVRFSPEGQPVAGRRPRPILVNIWYPAARRGAATMPYRMYLEGSVAIAGPAQRDHAQALERYQRGIIDGELLGGVRDSAPPAIRAAYDRFWNGATRVFRNAVPAAGRFPVVIYTQGAGSSFEDNAGLAEFLASQGFVVLGSAYSQEDGRALSTNASDRSRERDIRLLTVEASRLRFARYDQIAVVGHSAGAQASLLLAAEGSAPVDAYVLLDTTQDPWTLRNRLWAYFTDRVVAERAVVTVPLLFVARPWAIFELADSLKGSERSMLTVPVLTHNEFISQGVVRAWLRGVGDSARADRARMVAEQYGRLSVTVLAWLNQRFGRPASAPGFPLVAVPAGETFPAGPAITPRRVRHVLSLDGPAAAARLMLEAFARDSADPAARLEVAMALAHGLYAGGRGADARALYDSLRLAQPRYGRMLGDARGWGTFFRQIREPAGAREWWSLVAALAPGDSAAQQNLRELEAEGAPRP